jgi:predicted DNA-binding transcriptional regulator YafY
MQVLRRHRGTVSGGVLARETGVSLRTIRRDIATLVLLAGWLFVDMLFT